MSKLWLVARKELGMMTRTTAYRIATAAGPLAIVVLLALPVMLERLIDSTAEGRTVAFVAAGPLLPAIRAELTAHGITVEEAAEESVLAPRVLAGDLDGYVVIPADVLGAEEPRYVIGDTVLMPRSRLISGVIGRAVVQRRLELEGLDADRVTTLTRLPQMQVLMLDEEGMVEPDLERSFWLMLAFIAMLLTMLIVYGQAVGHAVLTEKTGKTAEIMLSSLPPLRTAGRQGVGQGIGGRAAVLGMDGDQLGGGRSAGVASGCGDIAARAARQPPRTGGILRAGVPALLGPVRDRGRYRHRRGEFLTAAVARVRHAAGAIGGGAGAAGRP